MEIFLFYFVRIKHVGMTCIKSSKLSSFILWPKRV